MARYIFDANKVQVTVVKERGRRSAAGSLHLSFRRTLIIFRLLGLFPIEGLSNYDGDKLSFQWFSLKTFRYSVCVLCIFLLNLLIINDIYYVGVHYYQLSITLIVVSCMWTILVMLMVTKNWQEVVKRADTLLEKVPIFENNIENMCFYFALGLLFLGVSDYVFYVVHMIRSTYACNRDLAPLYAFYTKYHSWLFHNIPFSYWFGITYQIIEFHTVFILYFKDIFVMLCSLYITALFNRLNEIIFDVETITPWNEIRMNYTRICQLVKLLDEQISSFVFMAHVCNMFYICHELFQLLNNDYSHDMKECFTENMSLELEESIFHGLALPGMILRAMVSTLLPARVYSASRLPLEALHTIPAHRYDLEAQKFMDQVYYSKVGFTGLGFFHVTRDMLLSMFGTIVTYEMVLLQFHEKPIEGSDNQYRA